MHLVRVIFTMMFGNTVLLPMNGFGSAERTWPIIPALPHRSASTIPAIVLREEERAGPAGLIPVKNSGITVALPREVSISQNDLWKFDPVTLEWTWVSGSLAIYQNGNFGTQGISAPTNQPPSRSGNNAWVDKDGNLWLFGGTDMNWPSAWE